MRSSYVLGTLGPVKFRGRPLQWFWWAPKMTTFVKKCKRAWNQEPEDSEETNFRDLAFGRRGLHWEWSTKLCNTGRLSEICKELRRDLPSLLYEENKDFPHRMLLIEQGAMQRKRWLLEKHPFGVRSEVDDRTRCQCLFGVGVNQGESKLRVLLRLKMVQTWAQTNWVPMCTAAKNNLFISEWNPINHRSVLAGPNVSVSWCVFWWHICLFSRCFVRMGRTSTKWVNISVESFVNPTVKTQNSKMHGPRVCSEVYEGDNTTHKTVCSREERDDPVNTNLKRSASERKGWSDSLTVCSFCDMICLDVL